MNSLVNFVSVTLVSMVIELKNEVLVLPFMEVIEASSLGCWYLEKLKNECMFWKPSTCSHIILGLSK